MKRQHVLREGFGHERHIPALECEKRPEVEIEDKVEDRPVVLWRSVI